MRRSRYLIYVPQDQLNNSANHVAGSDGSADLKVGSWAANRLTSVGSSADAPTVDRASPLRARLVLILVTES